MRVLLTRPRAASQVLAARLIDLGHEVLEAPLQDYVPQQPVWPQERPDALICTSAQAPLMLARDDLCDVPLYPIGPATAAAARAMGFRHVMRDAGGERLQLLQQLAAERPTTSWWLCGAANASDLVAEMANLGLHCQRIVCYQMVPAPTLPEAVVARLKSRALDLVLLLSPATSRHWLRLLSQHEIDARWLPAACLSDAVAEPLRDCSWQHLLVAPRPVLDSLLAAAGLTCNMALPPPESTTHG